MLGFFSGFPDRRFPPAVAERLRGALSQRGSIVFISVWPRDYERNDGDLAGMYRMFTEQGMAFGRHSVIDCRWEPSKAVDELREASCVFLMGGHPGQQIQLIRDMGLDAAIRECGGAVLGVSAGALNMARRSLDPKESPVPDAGLGQADLTVKPHFSPADGQVLSTLLEISMELPICAMEDNSAIFAAGEEITPVGSVHWIDRGEIGPFSPQSPRF